MKRKKLMSMASLIMSIIFIAPFLVGWGSESSDNTNKNSISESRDERMTSSRSLSVKGSKLVDKNGKTVQLRGMSSHGLAWFPQYVNYESIKQMKEDWNVNLFRVAMYTSEYNGYCVGDEANRNALKSKIDEAVKATKDLGVYLIIDWHTLSDNNPQTYQNESIAFFKEMAEKYKDEDHIIYEICNEPNGSTSWENVKSYANAVIPVIRNYTDAIVLVGTTTWSQDIDKAVNNPITGFKNIMYTLHFYADTHRDDLRKKMESAINSGLPVFVSEFGICDASGNGPINISEADKWLNLMNKYDISFAMWNFSNKNESSSMINSSSNKTSGFEYSDLTATGKWFVDRMSTYTEDDDTEIVTNGKTVILASGEKYTDVLTATVLANEKNAPLLLTSKDVLSENTLNEIKRLGTPEIIIVGGENSVSPKVLAKLKGFKITRIYGNDRYETAINIGNEVRALSGNKEGAVLVDGTNFPDVITISSLATQKRVPILITEPKLLNNLTENALRSWNINDVVIGGGYNSVSKEIENNLSSIKTTRFGGDDRYETAVVIGEEVRKSGSKDEMILVDGTNFPDGIAINSLASKYKAPIMLTNPNMLTEVTANNIRSWNVEGILICGGYNSVSKSIEDSLSANKKERISGSDRYETAVRISQKLSKDESKLVN